MPATCPIGRVDHWWLCGPYGMVTDAMEVLRELGVPSDRTHRELFYVEDTDTVYRRALQAGAVSIEEPAEMPYGDRRATVEDPCGNIWQIATHQEGPKTP